jgi:hypothetical protein
VISNINDFGWHAVNVIEDDGHPPWTYTIGFYEPWGFPELIIIGRSRVTAHHILETIALRLDADDRPDLNINTDTLIRGAECHFLEVSPQYYSDYVGFARWFYRRRHFPLYQIVWPNTDRLYPWDNHAPDSFPLASNHCDVFKKYSRPAGNAARSIRSEMTGCRFELARSTSLKM